MPSSRPPRAQNKTVSVDELANKLSSGLSLTNGKGKQKAATLAEQKVTAMRAANAASQALSNFIRSGHKKSSKTLKELTTSAGSAATHFNTLRELCPLDLDVERAASSVLAKLIALEMYDLALSALTKLHGQLCLLANCDGTSLRSLKLTHSQHNLYLLFIPLVVSTDQTLLTLISHYLLHSLIVLLNLLSTSQNLSSFAKALMNGPSLPQWIPSLSALPEQQTESLLGRVYSTLTKSTSSSEPGTLFIIRSYALSCLAYSSADSLKKPDNFWDQACKFAVSYVRSCTTIPVQEEASRMISSAFTNIVTIVEKRSDSGIFLQGKGFMGFCEYWMSVANKTGDLVVLDFIVKKIQSPSVLPSAPDTIQQVDMSEDILSIECTKLIATLTQTTASLTQTTVEAKQLTSLAEVLKTSPAASALLPSPNRPESLQRTIDKLERALERLRKAIVKLLEGSDHSQPTDALRQLLEAVIDTLRQTLQRDSESSFTPVLDGLFALARTGLNVGDTRTYITTYDYLERAMVLLGVKDESNSPLPGHANYIRCLSGAFHNTAGTLYQAGRYGSAIGFLKDGCRLGSVALTMRKSSKTSGKEEGWKQLEDQLHRRWQLLAVCYSKIEDRKLAFEAYIQCIKAFPYAEAGFEHLTASKSVNVVFASSSAFKELGDVIERLTYLGACELLLPADKVSLDKLNLEPGTTGALLEKQLDSLESGRSKDIVRPIIVAIMRSAINVFTNGDMPLRTTRVLLRALEFAYHVGPSVIDSIGTPDDVGRTIENLVARETFGSDQGLSQFCSQFRASAHLLLALHAHRRADPKQVLVVGQHATEACNLLKALLAQSSSIASPPPKKSPAARVLKPKNETAPPQRVKTVPPKTPRKRPPKSMQEVSLRPSPSPKPLSEYAISLVIEDVNRLIRLLTLTSHILDLLSLTLPRLHTLDLLKAISEQYRGRLSDDFVVASTNLGCEYVRLGQLKRAGSLFSQVFPGIEKVSIEAKIIFFLRYAESFALMDDVPQSVTFYLQALDLCQYLMDDRKGSTSQRVHNRIVRLERAATACYVFSVIQYSRDDPLASLQALLQSLRLWNRAFEALNRLYPTAPASSSTTEDDPFQASALQEAPPIEDPKSTLKRSSIGVMEWRISQGLLATMFALCQAYKERGSVREAEYFAQEAKELAEALNAPVMIGRALTQKAELQLHQGLFEEGSLTVSKALGIQQNLPGADAAEMMRLRAKYNEQIACHEDAHQSYVLSNAMLEELNQSFNNFDGFTFESRQSLGQRKKNDEVVFPDLVAKVLRQQIWLLRDHNSESYNTLVDRFLRLPATSRVKIEESFLNSQLALHSVQKRFRSDIYFSSIAESTIALPLGSSNGSAPATTQSSQDMLQNLDNAEKLFWSDLSLVSRRGHVFHVRDSLLSLATIRAFQTSLGRLDNIGSQVVATLLDRGAAITLRRELLEAISQKCFGNSDDLKWPSLDEAGKPLPRSQLNSSAHLLFRDPDDGAGVSMKEYWESLLTTYQSHQADLRSFSTSQTSSLPKNWTIIHISVTGDQNTLFVSRQRGGSSNPPLVFCVPLKGRREDDNDEHLTFEDAIREFKDIVRLNNESTKSAIRVKEQEAKAQWWKQRRALDTRMRELVENIEFCWLGAFKTILSPCPNHSPELIAKLRLEFDKVFQQGLHLQDKKTKQRALGHKKVASESKTPNRVTLDDVLVECFSTLSPQCRDEELEDLVYFMLDLYQFYGVPVSVAEIDITQVVVDLRSVLEEHHGQMERRRIRREASDEHIFLILDKNVQGLPWENIPALRGRSVSRVPCLDFLLDRMQLARRQKQAGDDDVVDRAVMNPRKGYYILNPSGDLTRTEGRFREWAKTMEGVGWKGLIGSAPSEQQMEDALQRNDLVLYFGHGGGEQYIRPHRIRHLRRCGALILWGCSSGALHETGEFDRVGTPLHYMVAGCPTLVANLWDVTDGDIDKFSQAVLDKWQMTAEKIRGWESESSQSKGTSLVAAVAQSRDACKLKYLTGAAPVVYGIPLYL